MAKALKDIYNEEFVNKISTSIRDVFPTFDNDTFYVKVFSGDWEGKTLKERMRQITNSLGETLPNNYKEAISILSAIVDKFPKNDLGCIFFPDFVEVFGLEDWDTSLNALELFTQHSTSEFAVRPFIVKDSERMMKQMLVWSEHSNEHVRRLASEGSRPRLPWGMVLRQLKVDPAMILPILENLKEDESLYVRKSVANNLNDISKDHPNLVLEIANKWYGKNPHTNWIIKHACRTLLKKGNVDALAIFGFDAVQSAVQINQFKISPEKLSIGEDLHFSFNLTSDQISSTKIRIEYAIDFVKAKGHRTKKIFKITENTLESGRILSYDKIHSLKDLSTRKHYKGLHTITILINGAEVISKDFILE